MRLSLASEPIVPGGVNLDWVGCTDRLAVVLDGLTESPETGCVHGTAWYVHQLGARLLLHASSAASLPDALAESIEEVTKLHNGTCDLSHPGSPCSTVCMIRQRSGSMDYLVLADSVVVLDAGAEPIAILDAAEKQYVAGFSDAAMSGDQDDLVRLIQSQQALRNTPDGYWVAQTDPAAAGHALAGSVTGVTGAVLASDGGARLVTDFAAMDWRGYLELADSDGPAGVIRATRKLEEADLDRVRWPRHKAKDDATVVVCKV